MSKHTAECDKCGRRVRVSKLGDVQVCIQTMSSPAEYEAWCDDCRGPDLSDVDEAYERAAARYDGEGKDWR